MKLKKLLILFLTLLMVTSCSILKEVLEEEEIQNVKPEAEIVGVKLKNLSFTQADLVFDMKLTNPNSVAVSLAGFDYDLFLNNSSFIKGKNDEKIEIKANDSSIITLPLSLVFSNIFKTYENLKDAEKIDYTLKTGFSVDVPVLGAVRVPLETSGDVPSLEMPTVAFKSLTLDKMITKYYIPIGAKVKLKIAVDNPNSSGLAMNKLDYDLKINGQNWVTGTTNKKMDIEKNGSGVVEVPIDLDFTKMGKSVLKLIEGDTTLNYELSGSSKLESSIPLVGEIDLPFTKKGSTNLLK